VALKIGATVRITRAPGEELNDCSVDQGSVGFINGLGQRKGGVGRLYYVNILDKNSFPDGVLAMNVAIPEDCLKLDPSKTLRDARDGYLNQVNSIAEAYEERGRNYQAVVDHLAKKYDLARDEVYAVYKAMLCFEDFYQTIIEK